jgi:hypothetical protein
VLLDPGFDGMTGLPNVDLTTFRGHATTQKTAIFILTAMRTSNLYMLKVVLSQLGILLCEFIYEVLWPTRRGTRRLSLLQEALNLKSA